MAQARELHSPRPRLERLALPVTTGYLWVMMILLGAIVLETFMIYPNIFSDPPQSLDLSMEFLSVRGPSDFFPPLGLLSWVLGTASLLLSAKVRGARVWLLVSVLAIIAEGVISMLYFWPRNEIMFVEGLTVHSAEHLRQVAAEFATFHWMSRMGLNTVSAIGAFVGFCVLYGGRVVRVTSRGA
ncbi:MAG TPA: hypothetical protein H9786_02995 [Candidatus Brachybacterium merdavium]|uniref:DUF1772 domain-containing protein n=1 Tax=Candidatus Brachybacterium merdavium TaxID=2838513 RepID=A0A9D2LBJ7_9MICO|nr:hypothetical protein [Candidatus Brachybacterium merdavium]